MKRMMLKVIACQTRCSWEGRVLRSHCAPIWNLMLYDFHVSFWAASLRASFVHDHLLSLWRSFGLYHDVTWAFCLCIYLHHQLIETFSSLHHVIPSKLSPQANDFQGQLIWWFDEESVYRLLTLWQIEDESLIWMNLTSGKQSWQMKVDLKWNNFVFFSAVALPPGSCAWTTMQRG